jgi:hypothetical protein
MTDHGYRTDPATTSPVPEHIREAIHAGHVGQAVIFCDGCGDEEAGDYTGETREVRFAAARAYLAEEKGWLISPSSDHCPPCASGAVAA